MSRDGRLMADLSPELLAVLGDRQPPVPRGVALPSEQLDRPYAVHMGGASAGRVDNRLHRCPRFPEILQIRQDVYPASGQKMRSACKNLPSSTGYGEMGRTGTAPRGGVESIAGEARSSASHTFGTRATQVQRPGAGRKRPHPFPAKNSDCEHRPAETGRAVIQLIRKRPMGDMCPNAMLTGCRHSSQQITVNCPNYSCSRRPCCASAAARRGIARRSRSRRRRAPHGSLRAPS